MRNYIIITLFLVSILSCKNNEVRERVNDVSVKVTELTWQDSTIDLGTIKSGDEVKVIFRYTNTGDIPLIFSKIKSTCGCTTVDERKTPVAPGATDSIVANFDSHKLVGTIERKIYVLANTKRQFYILRVKANAI